MWWASQSWHRLDVKISIRNLRFGIQSIGLAMAVMRARVLLVDPQDTFRNSLSIKLRGEGYLVACAQNGREGYERASENPPDIVLLELNMHVWDGPTALRKFREDPRLCHIPMIVVTDDAQEASVRSALELGARDYILKNETNIDLLLQRLKLLHGFYGRSSITPVSPSAIKLNSEFRVEVREPPDTAHRGSVPPLRQG